MHGKRIYLFLIASLCGFGLLVLIANFNSVRLLFTKAAPAPIGSVHINPEGITTDIMGKNVNLSTLAYDTAGLPISNGVSYQWGISSSNDIGKLFPNASNDKLATFEPSRSVRGQADVWVKAFDAGGNTVIGSIPVYVGPSPTPTPSSAHAGPGELTDIQIKTYASSWSSNGSSTTIEIRGSRVDPHSGLFGYYPSGTTTNKITFTKYTDVFYSSTTILPTTCIDITTTSETYLATFCLRNNAVGINNTDYAYAATRSLTTTDARMRIYYRYTKYINGGTPKTLQSITMAFHRYDTPNFIPTNFYWTAQTNLDPTTLDSLEFWMLPNTFVPCGTGYAVIKKFASILPDPNSTGIIADAFPSPECWFRAKETLINRTFTSFDRLVLALTPAPTYPTPTNTPIPTSTPTPTVCLPADINKNGTVDGNDLSVLFKNVFSTNPSPVRADINGDGIVDLTDYSIIVRDYGKSTGSCI